MSPVRRWMGSFVLFGVPVLAAFGVAGWSSFVDGSTDAVSETIEISSDVPAPFATVDELVASSDAVVLAEVLDSVDGRTVTDPTAPEVGIRTRLAELRVVQILAGDVPNRLVLEEVASLTDGTPVAVDGASPVVVGDRGVFFLVAGGSEQAPHWALVGSQGRFLVRGEALEAAGDDPLSVAIEAGGGPVLTDVVRSIAG